MIEIIFLVIFRALFSILSTLCFSNRLILAVKNTTIVQIFDAMPDPTRQDYDDIETVHIMNHCYYFKLYKLDNIRLQTSIL